MNHITFRNFEGVEPIEQARRAILHVLDQVLIDSALAYYIGPGSGSWSKLTEAAATLHGEPLELVRRHYVNPHAKNPREGTA